MKIFNKKPKRTIYVIVEFVDKRMNSLKVVDYPQELPLPRYGDKLYFESRMGNVIQVVHSTSGLVTEIKIVVKQYG